MITFDYEGGGGGLAIDYVIKNIRIFYRILLNVGQIQSLIFKIFSRFGCTNQGTSISNILHEIMTKIFSVCALLSIDNYYHSKFTQYKMHSSFLHGLKVSLHIARFSQISLRQPGSSVLVRLACWCFIISSHDILDLDMIQRQAVSVAHFFFSQIQISFFLIISK